VVISDQTLITVQKLITDSKTTDRTWLITGVAGFIGSNLLECLLLCGEKVIGIDDFSTGSLANLDEVNELVGSKLWSNFEFVKGDIRNKDLLENLLKNVTFVLHQAALGSVPRSIKDPITTNDVNITGFLNLLSSAVENKDIRIVYAASSSTYGDHKSHPKVESQIGQPLSPYAITKLVNEIYAQNFNKLFSLKITGLRYFNVFGPRQDPEGAYAAVIPKWIYSTLKTQSVEINGDGQTSRDFCFIENVVQANIRAAFNISSDHQVYNVAYGESTSLNQLLTYIQNYCNMKKYTNASIDPIYKDFRVGDVKQSLASLDKIKSRLKYDPKFSLEDGLRLTIDYFYGK
jgi:UDP-N-acetylglucosamine 4-epimerase